MTPDDLRRQAFAEAPVVVPFLPPHLRLVPPEITSRRDPDRAAKAEWYDLWREEFLLYRRWLVGYFDDERKAWIDGAAHADTPEGRDLRKMTRSASMRDPIFFIAVFCYVFEPRQSVRDKAMKAGLNPFIAFTIQCRLVRHLQWMLTEDGENADVLVSKSRDMGATWLVSMFFLWGFLFMDPFIGKIVSRSEGEVDKTNQIDAVMVRIVENLDRQHERTPWILPVGFHPKKNRRDLLIFRNDNLNNLHGEATQPGSTGRGGRATMALVDEAAAFRGFSEIWATLVNTTDHRVGVSTENFKFGEDFWEEQHKPGAVVFGMDWWTHPWHDDKWYHDTKKRMRDDGKFAREVERNPLGDDQEWVYPQVAEMNLQVGNFPFPPDGKQLGWEVFVSIDPGKDDEACFHWIARDPMTGRFRLLQTYTNSHRPPEFYASIVLGVDDPHFRHQYKQPDLDMIAWVRRHPLPEDFFGDPAGASNAVDDDHANTWYGRFELYLVGRGHELRAERFEREQEQERRRAPHAPGLPYDEPVLAVYRRGVIYQTHGDTRFITGRRAALQALFLDLDFNDTPQVRRTLQALRELKFEQHQGALPPVNERSNYSHTWRAHRAASLEYFAVNIEARLFTRTRSRTRTRKGGGYGRAAA